MISESLSKDLSKMAIATEKLIKATSSNIESTSLQKSMESLKTLVNSKMNTLNQSISNLKGEVSILKKELALQSKNQRLEWAISNTEISSFGYYKKDSFEEFNSKDLVLEILVWFRRGEGYDIENYSMTQYFGNQKVEEGEKQFRDALSEQIYDLIGLEPIISLDDDGYGIYYS